MIRPDWEKKMKIAEKWHCESTGTAEAFEAGFEVGVIYRINRLRAEELIEQGWVKRIEFKTNKKAEE